MAVAFPADALGVVGVVFEGGVVEGFLQAVNSQRGQQEGEVE